MKITDYAPRAAPFDTHLGSVGRALVGAEVGVDVGAHAEALLRYCDIKLLHLIDPWANRYFQGICEGRLGALGFMSRVKLDRGESHKAAIRFPHASLDFVYIDQLHDPESVKADLRLWWTTIRPGGILGYRNYTARDTPLDRAVDEFLRDHDKQLQAKVEDGEIVIVKALPLVSKH